MDIERWWYKLGCKSARSPVAPASISELDEELRYHVKSAR